MTILNSLGSEWNEIMEHESYSGSSPFIGANANLVTESDRYFSNSFEADKTCYIYFPERDEIYFQTYFWFNFCYELFYSYQIVDLLSWLDEGEVIGKLNIHKDATLSLYIGDDETLKFTSNPVYDYRWHVIEVRVKIHPVNGNLTLRIDGEEVYSFDGNILPTTSPSTSAINSIRYRNQAYYTDMYFDNIIVNDINGTTNNSWPAGAKIRLIVPNAAGTTTQWTRSTGSTNYGCVDAISTDYVYANNTSLIDLYGMQNLNSGANKILWVSYDYYIQGSSLTVKNFTPVVRLSGTNYFGKITNIPYSIDLVRQYWETSPATSAAWTVSELNGMEFGMRSEL